MGVKIDFAADAAFQKQAMPRMHDESK